MELCSSPASASTTTLTVSPKHKDTSSSAGMASKRLTLSSSSSHSTFRPSPLNPHSAAPPADLTPKQQKRSSFPASRPLRPFPSISQSLSTTTTIGTSEVQGDSKPVKRSQKTLELSSKWTGGFIVLGMTQAEFSRQD